MNKTRAKTAVLRDRSQQRLTYALSLLALAALTLAWLALPQIARAQGIVGGAREGAYEGNRVGGPVGGVVGGAVGAGVGGAVGAVEGVLGVPHRSYYHRHYRCRGYRDRTGHFHCYR